MPQEKNTDWTEERIARLGTATDDALAKEWGVTLYAVWLQRHKMGVAPCRKHRTLGNARKWTPQEEETLRASVNVSTAARQVGINYHTARKKWIELGRPVPVRPNRKHSDDAVRAMFEECGGTVKGLAEKLGVTKQRAQQLCVRAGIRKNRSRNKGD